MTSHVTELQEQIQTFLNSCQHSSAGSIQCCSVYLTQLHSLLESQHEARVCLEQLYAAKVKLQRQIARRYLTPALVRTLRQVELFTHEALDFIKSEEHFTEPEPRLDFRFDWRSETTPIHSPSVS